MYPIELNKGGSYKRQSFTRIHVLSKQHWIEWDLNWSILYERVCFTWCDFTRLDFSRFVFDLNRKPFRLICRWTSLFWRNFLHILSRYGSRKRKVCVYKYIYIKNINISKYIWVNAIFEPPSHKFHLNVSFIASSCWVPLTFPLARWECSSLYRVLCYKHLVKQTQFSYTIY